MARHAVKVENRSGLTFLALGGALPHFNEDTGIYPIFHRCWLISMLYTFFTFLCEKKKYCADWSEWTNQLTVTRITPVHSGKNEKLLIGQSGARELLPQNHLNDENHGFRKLYLLSYFLQRTFENNRKMTFMETNQPLLLPLLIQPEEIDSHSILIHDIVTDITTPLY